MFDKTLQDTIDYLMQPINDPGNILSSHNMNWSSEMVREIIKEFVSRLPKESSPYEQAKLYRELTGIADNG